MCAMTLKAVPKPEGHDLNARRADAAADASRWLPEDALYSAYEELSRTKPYGALIVAWYEQRENGDIALRLRLWNDRVNDVTALAAEVFHKMTPHG
jgi:hypothetical protein